MSILFLPLALQVHIVVLTDDPETESACEGRTSAVLSWLGVTRGSYLPGSSV